MKTCWICICLMALSLAGFAQTETEWRKNLQRDAGSMSEAFNKKDFKTFAQYTHPAIVKMLGGTDAFAHTTDSIMRDMQDVITEFTITSIDTPKEIITGEILQCIVSSTSIMVLDGKKMQLTGYLLAVSANKGVNWVFLDCAGKDVATIKMFEPLLSDKIVIPAAQQPKVVN